MTCQWQHDGAALWTPTSNQDPKALTAKPLLSIVTEPQKN